VCAQVFLLAMFCSIVFTVLFTFGSAVWYFTLVWIGNRFVQAAGTPAVNVPRGCLRIS
jgi:hypothetical protein